MRHILSTALVAVLVGSLAGVTAGTLAQAEPETERSVTPAATVANADKVDGQHAVPYTGNKSKRKYRLVATNRNGMLPGNIVKPYWGNIQNKPKGFADGVDNAGVTKLKLTRVMTGKSIPAGQRSAVYAYCPPEPASFAVGGGFHLNNDDVVVLHSLPLTTNPSGWKLMVKNNASVAENAYVFAVCLTAWPDNTLAFDTLTAE